MRIAIVLCACWLSACAVKHDSGVTTRVHSFYSLYLTSLTSSERELSNPDLREYISADTLSRIEQIEAIPEQDLLESDYFAYAQDYDPAWVPALTVGPTTTFMGGEVLPVWIGVENGRKNRT